MDAGQNDQVKPWTLPEFDVCPNAQFHLLRYISLHSFRTSRFVYAYAHFDFTFSLRQPLTCGLASEKLQISLRLREGRDINLRYRRPFGYSITVCLTSHRVYVRTEHSIRRLCRYCITYRFRIGHGPRLWNVPPPPCSREGNPSRIYRDDSSANHSAHFMVHLRTTHYTWSWSP